MEYFSSGGGAPGHFAHRIRVSEVTDDMYHWCLSYDDEGRHFRRWSIEWGSINFRNHDTVHFEWDQAALMFRLKFGEYCV